MSFMRIESVTTRLRGCLLMRETNRELLSHPFRIRIRPHRTAGMEGEEGDEEVHSLEEWPKCARWSINSDGSFGHSFVIH